MAIAKKKAKKVSKKVAARGRGGDSPSLLPVDDLIAHQNALERLARSLERLGLRDQAAQLRGEIARLRAAILDALVRLLGDREPKTRDAATRTLRDLLEKDLSVLDALLRARDTTTDPEIRDRLRRRILVATAAVIQRQIDDSLADASLMVLLVITGAQPDDPEFQRVFAELSRDLKEAQADAEDAKTDTDARRALERFERFEQREERREARQPFFDELQRKLLGG